jgi:hypothetical protein
LHRLQGVDNRAQSPFWEEAEYLFVDSLQTLFRIHDGIDIVLKCAQQKTLKMLTRSRRDLPDDAAQPDQVAHGFMIGVGNPDGRQLSSPMKTGEHGRVTTICLHPIARLRRNQRRRHHVAPMAEACELAMNAIATRSGLTTKRQWLARAPQAVAQLADSARFIDYSAAPERPLSATAIEIRSV